MKRSGLAVATLFTILVTAIGYGQTTLQTYRYQIETRSQDFIYAQQLPKWHSGGTYYVVETDDRGRFASVTEMRNERTVLRTVYQFQGTKELPVSFEEFRYGQSDGIVEIDRNPDGTCSRKRHLNSHREPTYYVVYSYYSPNSVEAKTYDRSDKLIQLRISRYYFFGKLADSKLYHSPEHRNEYDEMEYDENTGALVKKSSMHDGSPGLIVRYKWDESGELIKEEWYEPPRPHVRSSCPDGNLTSAQFYNNGEEAQEVRYFYDDDHRLQRAQLLYKWQLICEFIFKTLPDGTVTGTVAKGSNGDLWAEYPGREVSDIARNGQPADGQKAIIHRTGDWW